MVCHLNFSFDHEAQFLFLVFDQGYGSWSARAPQAQRHTFLGIKSNPHAATAMCGTHIFLLDEVNPSHRHYTFRLSTCMATNRPDCYNGGVFATYDSPLINSTTQVSDLCQLFWLLDDLKWYANLCGNNWNHISQHLDVCPPGSAWGDRTSELSNVIGTF